jgi:cytochrome c-type protein NapB
VRRAREEAPRTGAAQVIDRDLRRKLLGIAVAIVLAGAASGFVTGTRPPEGPRFGSTKPAPTTGERAPSYAELRELRRGPNGPIYNGAIEALAPERGLLDPVVQTDADKRHALDARAARRAYDGAPPTIPHAVAQMGPPECVSCHEKGGVIAGRVAPRPSHAAYASCTQCHVVEADPRPPAAPRAEPLAGNSFAGAASPDRGDRAWAGAPPTIPHATLMRTECAACHGPAGRLGMKSTHAWRQSCTQCHAPSAALDQRPLAAMGGATP